LEQIKQKEDERLAQEKALHEAEIARLRKELQEEIKGEDLVPKGNENERTCNKCIKDKGMSWCHEHQDKFIDHKCMYCCGVALYNCGGDNFFCAYHHHDGKGRPEYEE